MNQVRPILEVIVTSLADALAAEAGGAHRLELVSRLDLGGLTPSVGLVHEITERVRLPVRVMLRETPGFIVTDRAERARLCALAGEMARLPVDGLVCGFLAAGGVDEELLAAVLAAAPDLKVTFHRAFEELPDPLAAMAQLKRHSQIDRLLTSGGTGQAEARAGRLAALQRAAAPEIRLLAGGGVDKALIEQLRRAGVVGEIHVGRLVRSPARADGWVSAELVRELIELHFHSH